MHAKYSRTGISEPITDIQSLATLIRDARRRQGMTQVELAGLSGTGARFIVDLERGKATVALNKVLSVLLVLGLRLRLEGVGQ